MPIFALTADETEKCNFGLSAVYMYLMTLTYAMIVTTHTHLKFETASETGGYPVPKMDNAANPYPAAFTR